MIRLAGKISIMCPFFHREAFFMTSLFLWVPQGWAIVPGLFGSVFISLSVLVSVIQLRCQPVPHAHHCVLLTIPWGPCSPSGGVAVICACVLSHLSHPTSCSVVTTSVLSRTCVLYKACTANTRISSSAHITCPRRAVLPFTPETTRPHGLGGWAGFQAPFPSAVPYLNN